MGGLKALVGGRDGGGREALVAGRADGLSTAVGGVRVGDGVEALPLDRATGIQPSGPPAPNRAWIDGGVFEVTADGRRVAVPRETLVAELRRYGGRVYVDRVSYQVTSGRIERIWVRGKALEGLPFSADAD